MLAGDLKLKTFLVAGGASVLLTLGGLAAFIVMRRPEPPPIVATITPATASATPATATPATARPARIAPASQPTPSAAGDLSRPQDTDVMRFVGQDLGSKKRKDVTSGKAYKVNVYQDDGKTSANRAKVDLDRDDKWDEKWTFDDDGSITRKVAPRDDEDYTEVWQWTGDAWTQAS